MVMVRIKYLPHVCNYLTWEYLIRYGRPFNHKVRCTEQFILFPGYKRGS